MKIISKFLFAMFMLISMGAIAQQDAQYTQWMFNKLSINPGYAVSSDYACASCLHRSQWVGLEGAPVSQSLNVRIPFYNKNVGLGLSINHDKIGPTNSWSVSGIYGYRFDFANDHKLGIGLQGTIRNYRVKYSETTALQAGDGQLPVADESRMIPNFGLGLYYYTPKYFVGLSVPHLLAGDLSFVNTDIGNSDFSREEVHAFLMAGVVFELNDALKLKPSLLFKYVKDAPFDADLHASLIFYDTFWAGLTYRMGGIGNSVGESLDMVLQLQLSRAIRLGFAYDFTLSKVKDYSDGTFEVVLDYCLNPGNDRLTNPRFF